MDAIPQSSASSATGRKEAGQEQVFNPDVAAEGLGRIVDLMQDVAEAQSELSNAIKALAEASKGNAAEIKTMANARFRDKVPELHRKVEQLSLMLQRTED